MSSEIPVAGVPQATGNSLYTLFTQLKLALQASFSWIERHDAEGDGTTMLHDRNVK